MDPSLAPETITGRPAGRSGRHPDPRGKSGPGPADLNLSATASPSPGRMSQPQGILPLAQGGAMVFTGAKVRSVLTGWVEPRLVRRLFLGFSFKLAPGIRIRASSRGLRTSIGPRAAWLHFRWPGLTGVLGQGVGTGQLIRATSDRDGMRADRTHRQGSAAYLIRHGTGGMGLSRYPIVSDLRIQSPAGPSTWFLPHPPVMRRCEDVQSSINRIPGRPPAQPSLG
jgi:hypothetical protein